MIEVLEPGALTTVQDLGRPGLGALGVPPSGAMDPIGLRAANLACGNEQSAAGLECTIAGPVVRFETDAVVALGGSTFAATLDGDPVTPHRAVRVRAGGVLDVGRSTTGARCYVCVRGGLATPVVLGSRSVLVSGGIGAPLRRGDRVPFGDADLSTALARVEPAALPSWARSVTLRVVPGPQDAAFTPEARTVFYGEAFRVSTRADRVGVRLDGPALRHRDGAEIPPEGLIWGAVQVPGDGTPIVLGADRPSTGGYAKIATVITADACLLGQAKPGDEVRFAETDLDDARVAWAALEARLATAVRR